MKTAIFDNKTIVFVEWIEGGIARISNGKKSIIVTKSRLKFI